MIVHATNEGWEIIHQQAHGLLAFKMAIHWQTEKRPIYWAETLTALVEHDDGQDPYVSRNHLSDVGTPMPFVAFSMEQCHRMIDIALHKSHWNALMVSHHATFLYEPKRGQDPEMDKFLDQQKDNQKKWRKACRATPQEVSYAYDFLQWFDALSLILCRKELPPEGRRLEISKGPDGKPYFIHQRTDDQSLSVEPWPFDATEFSVHTEVHLVNQLRFEDDKELYNAISNAPVEVREWIFRK